MDNKGEQVDWAGLQNQPDGVNGLSGKLLSIPSCIEGRSSGGSDH
jgi:hypothetical protein